VAVTGAAGGVGRQVLAALEEQTVRPLTHRPHPDIDGQVLEITDYEATVAALDGVDTVVHLAANPSPEAPWDDVLHTNIDGTYNVFAAAVENDVDRVVFASTNHVAQMYNIGDVGRPETLGPDAVPAHPGDPPRPDSFYAVSKVAGEALGSYYADRHGLEVVNLRIGWLLTAEELRDRQDEPESVARYARAMWLSPRDCRDAARRSVEVPLPESPLTVNLVSRNTERYLSLTEAMRHLGYAPRDDSAEALS